jgi:hypothetical protein
MRKTLLGIAVACLVAGGAFADRPIGIIGTQVRPIERENGPFYMPCLGEEVINYVFGEARYHIFQTSSGTQHFIDMWLVKSFLVGQDTGTVWLGYANSPLEFNAKLEQGAVRQWVVHWRFVPDGGHGTEVVGQNTWKYTVNANGELVMLNDETPSEDVWNCVGPEK